MKSMYRNILLGLLLIPAGQAVAGQVDGRIVVRTGHAHNAPHVVAGVFIGHRHRLYSAPRHPYYRPYYHRFRHPWLHRHGYYHGHRHGRGR